MMVLTKIRTKSFLAEPVRTLRSWWNLYAALLTASHSS
jgi:hypothetical protein